MVRRPGAGRLLGLCCVLLLLASAVDLADAKKKKKKKKEAVRSARAVLRFLRASARARLADCGALRRQGKTSVQFGKGSGTDYSGCPPALPAAPAPGGAGIRESVSLLDREPFRRCPQGERRGV